MLGELSTGRKKSCIFKDVHPEIVVFVGFSLTLKVKRGGAGNGVMSIAFPVNIFLIFVTLVGSASATVSSGKYSLSPCPSSPNCVSSLSQDEDHYIEPFLCSLPFEEARTALAEAIAMIKGGRVVVSEGRYLRAEFVSNWLKFVDDVEFVIDEKSGIINLRSASRVGYSDFGVNRRRIEELRGYFMKIVFQP